MHMGHPHSHSPQQRHDHDAQQAAVMKGYGKALSAAYRVEPLPPGFQRLLEKLEAREQHGP